MEQILFRKMEIGDFEAVQALSLELGHPCTAETVRACISHILNQTRDIVLVAQLGDQAVGYVHGAPHALLYAKPLMNIVAFVISEPYRSQGIGGEMLKYFEACAREKGYAGVRLGCRMERVDTHRFYERQGYENRKSQKSFMKMFE